MNSKLKHGSLKTSVDAIIYQSIDRDQVDLKSSTQKENGEWLWVLKSGKMVEIDNKGRVLTVAGAGSENEESEMCYGLDWWVG